MSEKKVATLNVWKALSGIPLAAFAAWGSATGNPWLAALLAVPAAGWATSDTIGDLLDKLRPQERSEHLLELPIPFWWKDSIPFWEGLCAEIGDHLPDILRSMDRRIQSIQGVLTMQIVRQIFIDALADEPLIWVSTADERRKVGESIAGPLLKKMDEVLKALRPLIEQRQRETLLVDVHAIAGNTEKAVNVLIGMREASKPQILSDKEIAHLRQEYCHTLHERWKMLDFKGIKHVEMNRPMGIPLTEVFVFPDLLVGLPEYETLERVDLFDGYDSEWENADQYWEDEQEQLAQQNFPQGLGKRITLQREDLHTVLATHSRLVILGDPGSGKSTLLRYLMLLLIQERGEFAAAFPQLALVSSAVPLYMALASYAEFWRSSPSVERTLKHFLPRYLSENYLDAYGDFLQEQLERGKVFLLLDGLDEIPDASLRVQIVRQIEVFTQTYPENYFIVTSRIVGYKGVQLAAGYQPHTLADFNEKQIRIFTQKWCPAYERWVRGTTDSKYLQNAATREADKLFNATQRNPGVKRLAINPLLLTILALIQRQGIELPSHRIELFDLCATTLIDTWVRAKGQNMQLSKNELVKILRPLAFWMHKHPEVGSVPEEELVKHIVKNLRERQLTVDEAMRRAEQILHTVRDELGILVERGKNRYGFLHLTFEEYFAAGELEQNENRNSFIRKHLHDPRWREVILLTVGIVGFTHSNEKGVTKLVQKAILKANSPFEEWLHRDLLFAGLCLADDVGTSVACEDDIIEQIVGLYLINPYDSLRNALSGVLTSWIGTPAAKKAANLVLIVLRLLHQRVPNLSTVSPQHLQSTATSFEEEVAEYYQGLIEQYKEPQIRLLRLRSLFILSQLQVDIGEWIEYVLEMLIDPNSNARQAVAKVLGQIGEGQPRIIDALLQLLSDTSGSVRWRAIKALGQARNGQPKVINALLQALSDPERPVRREAALTLGRIGDGQPAIIDALLQLLSDTEISRSSRKSAAEALTQVGGGQPRVVNALLQLLSDPDPYMKFVATELLGQVGEGQPNVVDALLRLLSDPYYYIMVRLAATEALGRLGDKQPRVLKALYKLCTDPNADMRLAAAEALAHLNSRQPHVIDVLLLLDLLLQLSSNSKQSVKIRVADALGISGNGQPHVIGTLLKLCTDSNADVTLAAVRALGQIGNGSSHVISTLFQLLSYPDWRVRQASARALIDLEVDPISVSLHLEELLQTYKSYEISQLEVDDDTDALLFALFQIVGGI